MNINVFFLQFQTYCKISFFSCLFLSEIWFFRHQNRWIMVKIFQLLQSQRKNLPDTFINVVSRNSCLDTRVAISQKEHVRIWCYIAHFNAFNVLIHLHLILWMGTFMRLWDSCAVPLRTTFWSGNCTHCTPPASNKERLVLLRCQLQGIS